MIRNCDIPWKKIYSLLFGLLPIVMLFITWMIGIFHLPAEFKGDHGDYTFNFISFFTTQSNLLVAGYLLAITFSNDKIKNRWFVSYNFALAVTAYITITFIIYNGLLLPTTYQNYGVLQWINNMIIHVVVPIGMIVYFLLLMDKPKNVQSFNQMWRHTGYKFYIYPILYCIFNLIRGLFREASDKAHAYPYFFLDISHKTHGIEGYIWLIIAVLLISLILFAFTSLYNYYYFKKAKN